MAARTRGGMPARRGLRRRPRPTPTCAWRSRLVSSVLPGIAEARSATTPPPTPTSTRGAANAPPGCRGSPSTSPPSPRSAWPPEQGLAQGALGTSAAPAALRSGDQDWAPRRCWWPISRSSQPKVLFHPEWRGAECRRGSAGRRGAPAGRDRRRRVVPQSPGARLAYRRRPGQMPGARAPVQVFPNHPVLGQVPHHIQRAVGPPRRRRPVSRLTPVQRAFQTSSTVLYPEISALRVCSARTITGPLEF